MRATLEQLQELMETLEEGIQKLNRQIDSKKISSKMKKSKMDKLAYDSDESTYRDSKRIQGKKKVGKVTESAKERYKKDDSDRRANDTFDAAEPFERRPYSHNSADTSDKHSFARDQGHSSRQGKKKKGLKPRQRDVDSHRKYLKTRLKLRKQND